MTKMTMAIFLKASPYWKENDRYKKEEWIMYPDHEPEFWKEVYKIVGEDVTVQQCKYLLLRFKKDQIYSKWGLKRSLQRAKLIFNSPKCNIEQFIEVFKGYSNEEFLENWIKNN
jgi:hypothetical protein